MNVRSVLRSYLRCTLRHIIRQTKSFSLVKVEIILDADKERALRKGRQSKYKDTKAIAQVKVLNKVIFV